MAILRNILFAFSALCLTGCFETFEPLAGSEPVLCINSVITAGETISVEVTHTWRVDSPDGDRRDRYVDDAIVSVYVNGELKDKDYVAREGDSIHIDVSSDTYGRAEADVTVPVACPVTVSGVTPTSVFAYAGEESDYYIGFGLRARLSIADRAGENNYYVFGSNTYMDYTGDNYWYSGTRLYGGTLDTDAEPIFSEHIGVTESVFGFDADGFTFFTDKQFSGKSYSLNLRYSDISYTSEPGYGYDDVPPCGIELIVYTVSESYYNWLSYLWQVNSGYVGNVGDVGFCDPAWGYSNVSTGAGVVAARSKSSATIVLTDFLQEELDKVRQPAE